jgi:hypothetical protein
MKKYSKEMKSLLNIFLPALLLVALSGCKKEETNEEGNSNHLLIIEDIDIAESILTVCDDTSAFKSSLDLVPFSYIRNCNTATAVKEVPGLGEIDWVGNSQGFLYNNHLYIRIVTYKFIDGYFLPREDATFSNIPLQEGMHQLFNTFQWQQNQNLAYGGYGRLLADGDVSDGFWRADTLCSNYIEITRLDLESKEVEGRFEMHLKMADQSSNGFLYSDRIVFKNGKFKASILN